MSREGTGESERVWMRLMRASRTTLAAIEAALKGAGLPPLSWYDALLELRRAGVGGLRPPGSSEGRYFCFFLAFLSFFSLAVSLALFVFAFGFLSLLFAMA